jgi:hypothetical protein
MPNLRLAAHKENPGDKLDEGVNQDYRYGKGTQAYNQIAGKVDWDKAQQTRFQRSMKFNIGKIGKELGLLFEVEVYIQLLDTMGLAPKDDAKDHFWAYAARDNREADLVKKCPPASAPLIVEFVQIHARDMAEKMVIQTQNALKCKPDVVAFAGGEGHGDITRHSPADIMIGCSGQMAGFNLKFGSENRVHTASLSFDSAYALMGGEDVMGFRRERTRPLLDQDKFVLGKLWELSQNFDPARFVKMLNYLIGGDEQMILPAMRNYATGRGDANWSAAFKKDFLIRGNTLYPRPDATIVVQDSQPQTYVQMTYKVPGGSPYGTSIYLEPKAEKVNVKVGNLA